MRSGSRPGLSRSPVKPIRPASPAMRPARRRTVAVRPATTSDAMLGVRWMLSRTSTPWPTSSNRSCLNEGPRSSPTPTRTGRSSRLWRAHRGARAGRAFRSPGERSTPACVAASIGRSCISRAEPLDAMPHEQLGRQQGRLVPMPMLDGRDQGMGGRGGDLIEFAPQYGSRRFGIEPGGREALVPEEALHVGDVDTEGEQLRRHRMAQQMRVDALRHARRTRHFAHDLADPLAGVDIRRGPGSSLAAGEQRTGAADANMQLEQLGELAPDRHLPALASLAPANDDDSLGEADVLGPDLDKLRHARASLQQGLQQKPGPAAPDIGLIDEPQLFLDGQAVDRGAAIGRRLQAGPLPGGFEHRLALKIVEALPDQDGGDRRDGAFDRPHAEFAERGSECKLMAETPPPGKTDRHRGAPDRSELSAPAVVGNSFASD